MVGSNFRSIASQAHHNRRATEDWEPSNPKKGKLILGIIVFESNFSFASKTRIELLPPFSTATIHACATHLRLRKPVVGRPLCDWPSMTVTRTQAGKTPR